MAYIENIFPFIEKKNITTEYPSSVSSFMGSVSFF